MATSDFEQRLRRGWKSLRNGWNGTRKRADAEDLRQPLSAGIEPTFFSRFECKYLVDPMLVPEIRAYLHSFTRPDRFAACQPNNRYAVCSLYLDSDDLALYQQTVSGEKTRFKLRVRTYTDAPESLAYFEVKKKANNVVHKRRAGLTRAQSSDVLEDRPAAWRETIAGRYRRDLEYFEHLAHRIRARPVMRVRYLREAYQSDGNEPARITLDSDLTYAVTLGADLGHRSGTWTATPLDQIILEIKFTERFPWWIQDFIRVFGLTQRAVPKYIMSVDNVLQQGSDGPLSLGNSLLPLRR